MLRHTNLEYRVIANHLSASGLQLAPQLTHAPSDQCDDRKAGDTPPYPFHVLATASLASIASDSHPADVSASQGPETR